MCKDLPPVAFSPLFYLERRFEGVTQRLPVPRFHDVTRVIVAVDKDLHRAHLGREALP